MIRFEGKNRSGWLPGVVGGALLLGVLWSQATAATVTLKIRAINPSKSDKQSVSVRQPLPKLVKPDDVVSAGELEVVYDVASKGYFVQKTVEIEPGQPMTFEVVIKDIWTIPDETIREMADQSKAIATSLQGTEQAVTGDKLIRIIQENLKAVSDRQSAYAVGVAKPIDHIRAYESNMEVMGRIRRDVGMLENLAITAGKMPQRLLGAPRVAPPVESESGSSTGDVVTLHIKVTNPSLTEKRPVPLRHDFPAEIKPTDVLDAGGLQIGFDAVRNVCYAYLESVMLTQQETKVYDVKLRNPWTDAWLKAPRLEERISELVRLTKQTPQYKAVGDQALALQKEIADLKAQKGPDVINAQYVAHARKQHEALREIEARIMRLEELFQPREKPVRFGVPMMEIPRPDRLTTWVIIYIILGFLGLFSVAFFFRWYGRSKAEKLDQEAGKESAAGGESSKPGNTPGAGKA
ncbi:MAG: hypothetical protein WCS01_03650 [bacterium]